MNLFLRLAVIVGALPVTLTNGTTADATQVMSDLNWIVNQVNANAAPLAGTALTNANNNFTVVQSGVAATAAANFPIASQVQNSVFNTFQSTLGTNTLTARCAALALTSWPTDGVFSFIPSQTNSGPASLTVDSAGSSIMFSMGSTLVGGELRAGVPAIVKRDATKLNLLTPANVRFDLASSTSGGFARVLVAYTQSPMMIGKSPSRTVLTTGSTYSPPSNCIRLFLRMAGGGGGGGGGPAGTGTAGQASAFGGFLTANGGSAGTGAGAGGAGGSASGGSINVTGGAGGGATGNSSASVTLGGNSGGSNPFGGAGAGTSPGGNGGNAAANSGAGGGAGGSAAGQGNGSSGGAGGYLEATINNPLPLYQYIVGVGGAGGVGASTSGGAGADGIIIVDEFFN